MFKKLKFKPEVTRVKLNPEQAVLNCPCARYGRTWSASVNDGDNYGGTSTVCNPTGTDRGHTLFYCDGPVVGTANRQRVVGGISSS